VEMVLLALGRESHHYFYVVYEKGERDNMRERESYAGER